jgi:hypothetical protein
LQNQHHLVLDCVVFPLANTSSVFRRKQFHIFFIKLKRFKQSH